MNFLKFSELEKVQELPGGSLKLEHSSPALRSPIWVKMPVEDLKEHLGDRPAPLAAARLPGWFWVLPLLMVLLFPVGMHFLIADTRHVGFSPKQGKALMVHTGLVERHELFDPKSGSGNRLSRHLRISTGIEYLQFLDPGVLTRHSEEGRHYLRFQGRNLTRGMSGRLSPDASMLAYASVRGSFILRSLDGGPRHIEIGAEPSRIRWSKDGEVVLVMFAKPDLYKVYVVHRNGQVAWRGEALWADFGPGSDQFSLLTGAASSQVEVRELTSGAVKNSIAADFWSRFAWQPGGRRLLALKDGQGVLCDAKGHELKNLDAAMSFTAVFEWSGDGEFFLWRSRRGQAAYCDLEGNLLREF